MKTTALCIFLALGVASLTAESPVGTFAPQKLGSRIELSASGDFSLESVSDPKVWFASGHWKISGKILVLSRGEEVARYSMDDEGQRLTLVRKSKAAATVEYPDVGLATEYKKEPIQQPQQQRP